MAQPFAHNDRLNSAPLHKIAVFASGAGSNAARFFDYFAENSLAQVTLLVCNKPDAPVLQLAQAHGIATYIIDKTMWQNPSMLLQKLKAEGITFVVLAGFLWQVPPLVVAAYANRMTNIHPALLPKYGGKGMYGSHVHKAVLAANETESGITIHFVNENYDEGAHIAQFRCAVAPTDTPATLAERVNRLELGHYAPTIAGVLTQL